MNRLAKHAELKTVKATGGKTKTAKKTTEVRPPDGKPKVQQGTGRHLAFMSDTLFDEDLKE